MSEFITNYQNTTKEGYTLLQVNPTVAIDFNKGEKQFYLYQQNDDLTWKELRMATKQEIEDAYDQSADFAILDAAKRQEEIKKSETNNEAPKKTVVQKILFLKQAAVKKVLKIK